MPSQGERVAVAESSNRIFNRVSKWCDICGMKFNASKTKTMIVSRSRTNPKSTRLTLDGNVLNKSDDLVILGVTFEAKMTFETHLRSVSRAAAQRLGTMRKSLHVFHDRSLFQRSFWCFVLSVLWYCSAVWCSTTDLHLNLSSWRCVRVQPCPTTICSSVVHAI